MCFWLIVQNNKIILTLIIIKTIINLTKILIIKKLINYNKHKKEEKP